MNLAERIRNELDGLKQEGLIHAERVVEWAKAHPDSALHGQFEWDDSEAAHAYRVWQARRVIALHVVQGTGERKLISLSIDRVSAGGYRDIEDVARQPELMKVAMKDALAELNRTRTRYKHLKELSDVWDAIERRSAEGQQERSAA